MLRSCFQPGRARADAPRFRATSGSRAPLPEGVSILAVGGNRRSEWIISAESSVPGGPVGSPHFLTPFLCPQKPGARMAGLEVLFASAAPAITCAQDALVCFLHWELVTRGYYSVGAGEQVRHGAARSQGGGAKVSSAQTHRTEGLVQGSAFPSPRSRFHGTVGTDCGWGGARLPQLSSEHLTTQCVENPRSETCFQHSLPVSEARTVWAWHRDGGSPPAHASPTWSVR